MPTDRTPRGRFAPSPSGRMHLGNAFCALLAWLGARAAGGEFVVRIEDLDPGRSREEWAGLLQEDLAWLGLDWDGPVTRQSGRTPLYARAFARLQAQGMLYPCFCSRDQLHAAQAPHGADGRVVYPGSCRRLDAARRQQLAAVRAPAYRLRVPAASIGFVDGCQGPCSQQLDREWGDFIVRRSDGVYAYQLAVVVDDGAMGITQVVRGRDLLSSTPCQLLLYSLLGLQAPRFYHLPLLLAPDGRRLSKRDRDLDFAGLRARFGDSRPLVGQLAFWAGLLPRAEAVSPRELVGQFSWEKVRRADVVLPAGWWS